MPIVYKIDILKELKEKGYSTYKIRKDKLLSEKTLTKIRKGEMVSWANIEKICRLLEIEVGDLLQLNDETK